MQTMADDFRDLPPELLKELRFRVLNRVTPEVLTAVIDGKMTQAEAARRLGVTRQAVNLAIRTHGQSPPEEGK
jgi:hypothetical protein